jgi:hypothetical protein
VRADEPRSPCDQVFHVPDPSVSPMGDRLGR